MGVDLDALSAFSGIVERNYTSKKYYSATIEFKNILLYSGLLSAVALVGCNRKFENLPYRYDSKEQRIYTLVCSGCHDTISNVPVIVDGRLAKSGKAVTVKEIVDLLQSPNEHKPSFKGALTEQEINDAASWIISDRLSVK